MNKSIIVLIVVVLTVCIGASAGYWGIEVPRGWHRMSGTMSQPFPQSIYVHGKGTRFETEFAKGWWIGGQGNFSGRTGPLRFVWGQVASIESDTHLTLVQSPFYQWHVTSPYIYLGY